MTDSEKSYTHQAAPDRLAVFDAPFVCANPDCDEAAPAPPDGSREQWERTRACPRCGGGMFRAPWAECVDREVGADVG